MTTDQIRAELRRSALEDARPSQDIDYEARMVANEFYRSEDHPQEWMPLTFSAWEIEWCAACRIFFLLVAEAL